MSISFLLLGTVNVVIQEHQDPPPGRPEQGILGGITSITHALTTNPFRAEPEGILTVDVSVQEGHSRRSTVTDHPVEDGADITDHIIKEPVPLTIEGIVTDTPSGIAALAVIPGLINRFASLPRSLRAFKLLEKWWAKETLLDVITSLWAYDSMVISSLDAPRNKDTGRALKFRLQFKQILTVSSSIDESSNSQMQGTGATTEMGVVTPP